MSAISDRAWDTVSIVRARIMRGWQVWETTRGTFWARRIRGWQGASQIESEPMTEEEEAVVDYVLQEEDQ